MKMDHKMKTVTQGTQGCMGRVPALPLKLRDSSHRASLTEPASTYVKWGDNPHNYEARMQK